MVDPLTLHVKDLFSKETAPDLFLGLTVVLTATGQRATIMGTFGKSGKLRVRLEEPV